MTSALNFLSSGGNTAVVRKLMGCVLISEDKSSQNDAEREKTIKSIIKKLKKNSGALDNLERAITNKDSTTDCVTLPKSLEGKVQFSQRKILPHLVSLRLWRWPDLDNQYEIRSIANCKYAFNPKKEDICINPYHYEKIPQRGIAPVLVPKNVFHGEALKASDRPSLDDFHSFIPSNINVPSSPSDSLSSYASGSPPPEYLSENESMDQDGDQRSLPNSPAADMNGVAMASVEYTEPLAWCSLYYYELNTRVGPVFNATVKDVSIDGFTDPSSASRFCLGLLGNINRNQAAEACRMHIGKGLRLYYIGSEVFAECESEYSIFIQSPNANQMWNWHPATVVKIPTGCHFKIFSNNTFAELLRHYVNEGFESVFQLTKMCTIRVSFVKGWGSDYRRQTVMSTPCWIEIHLNGPLQWLDKVLKQMGGPSVPCSSVS